MRAGRAGVAVALAFGAGCLLPVGCDWRAFDTLQGGTPVLSVGAPSGYPASQDFGSVLVALSPPPDGSAAARFASSARSAPAIAIVTLDAAGHASSTNVTAAVPGLGSDQAITAMAEVRGANQVLLGAPNPSGGGDLLRLKLDPPYEVTPFVTSLDPQFGVGVAAGALGGGAADDLVAVSGNALYVFVDGQSTAPTLYYTDPGTGACPLFLSAALPSRFRVNRAVVIGSLLAGGGVQIAVGTPATSGPGSVSIFNVDTASGKATCALTLTGSSISDARYGQALAVGDFDGDGIADLLVGAPPTHATLYRGPVTATATATILGPSGGDFGAALASLNLDGKSGDEALIADPEATVGSTLLAGSVSIFKGPALGTAVAPTPAVSALADHDPAAGEAYGSAVAALSFCAPKAAAADGGAGCVSTSLPLVGASSKAFTYFTLGPIDPRAK